MRLETPDTRQLVLLAAALVSAAVLITALAYGKTSNSVGDSRRRADWGLDLASASLVFIATAMAYFGEVLPVDPDSNLFELALWSIFAGALMLAVRLQDQGATQIPTLLAVSAVASLALLAANVFDSREAPVGAVLAAIISTSSLVGSIAVQPNSWSLPGLLAPTGWFLISAGSLTLATDTGSDAWRALSIALVATGSLLLRAEPYSTRRLASIPIGDHRWWLAAFATLATGVFVAGDLAANEGTRASAQIGVSIFAVTVIGFLILIDRKQTFARARALDHSVKALTDLSLVDSLTSVGNRRALDENLTTEFERASRFDHDLGVLMIDLNNLKAINDSLGHAAGDDALRLLAQVLVASIRTIDSAYRYGGDEFVVILPETDCAGSEAVARRIMAETKALPVSGKRGPLEASIGGSCRSVNDGSAMELLAAADRNLYRSKAVGNSVIVGT